MSFDPIGFTFPKSGGNSAELAKIKADGGVGYTEDIAEVVFPESEILMTIKNVLEAEYKWPDGAVPFMVVPGEEYQVSWNGEEWACTAVAVTGTPYAYLGDGSLAGGLGPDTGEPFCYAVVGNLAFLCAPAKLLSDRLVTFGVTKKGTKSYPIASKYLPEGGVGYTSESFVELIPEATYEFNGGSLEYSLSAIPDNAHTILTKIDGMEYKSATQVVPNPELGGDVIVAGNGSMLGLANTGEPYVVLITEMEGTAFAIVAVLTDAESGEPTQHTVSVSVSEPEVHTIDPKYLPNGGVGYTGTTVEAGVLEWDGDTTGKTSVNMGNATLVKLLDRVIDESEIEGVSYFVLETGDITYYPGEELMIIPDPDTGMTMVMLPNQAYAVMMLFADVPEMGLTKGTYGAYVNGFGYTAAIHGVMVETETVHTIDPKYIPEPASINLADYGVDVPSLVLAGGGRQEFGDAATAEALSQYVTENQPLYACMPVTAFGFTARCLITTLQVSDMGGMSGAMAFALNLMYGTNMLSASINIGSGSALGKGIIVDAVVTQTPIPGL